MISASRRGSGKFLLPVKHPLKDISSQINRCPVSWSIFLYEQGLPRVAKMAAILVSAGVRRLCGHRRRHGYALHAYEYDEAQSWLIVRDCTIPHILGHVLRYEGHPSLWYLTIAIPAKLHFPYETANYLAAAIAYARGSVVSGTLAFSTCHEGDHTVWLLHLLPIRGGRPKLRTFALLLFAVASIISAQLERPIAFSLLCCLLLNCIFTFLHRRLSDGCLGD